MLNLEPFFQHGKCCPVCNQKLSLYAKIGDIGTFKCSNNFVSNKKKKLTFYPLKDIVFPLHQNVNKTDSFTIKLLDEDDFSFSFVNESLFHLILKSEISFFYLCNPHSIQRGNNGSINDYHFDAFDVCYYKSSVSLFFKTENNKTSLLANECVNKNTTTEILSLKQDNKMYSLVYNFNDNKSVLYFNDSIDKDNVKKSFVKEMDLLKYYPDFSDKEKVINKFDSWILLS